MDFFLFMIYKKKKINRLSLDFLQGWFTIFNSHVYRRMMLFYQTYPKRINSKYILRVNKFKFFFRTTKKRLQRRNHYEKMEI